MNSQYQVVNTPLHGDGVNALQPFHPKDIVFSEAPFFFLQSLPNRQNALVCSCCYRFLGSVGIQMKYLQKQISRQHFGEHPGFQKDIKEYQHLTSVYSCPFQCGELYCSEHCQQIHWNEKGHCFLCTGQINENEIDINPLYQLKTFAVQSNEIFLMIADIIATWIVRNENEFLREKLLDPVEVMNQYVRNIWWEAIAAPKNQNKKQFQKILTNLVKDLWDHLNDTFGLKQKGYDQIFTKEWIARSVLS
jgi:hypothetical protein